MPKMKASEKLSEFISRFMKSKKESKEFPKDKQRLAVGYSEAKEEAKQRK